MKISKYLSEVYSHIDAIRIKVQKIELPMEKYARENKKQSV